MKIHSLFFILLLFGLAGLLFSQNGISIEPGEIILEEGSLSPLFHGGIPIQIGNMDKGTTEITLISSHKNILVDPSTHSFTGPGEQTFLIRYEGDIPERENMFFSLMIMNRTERTTKTFLLYHPQAYTPPKESQSQLNPRDFDIILTYYYSPTCQSCQEFLDKEIPLIEKELDLKIGMELRNVFDKTNMDLMTARLKEAGMDTNALPLLDTGKVILAGEDTITEWLHEALKGEPLPSSVMNGGKLSRPQAPLWLMVAGAGLLDGINPCAFSTLIFLLAYLGLRKRSRREILGVGLSFTLTVFVTYTAVGAGAFVLLRESQSLRGVSHILKWGGAAVLMLLSLLSFRDWIRVRRGELKELTLQMSPVMKKAVHKSVREGVKSTVPLLGSCIMGFLVTIYELGCTGQIYLPTLYLMTQQGEKGGWSLLFLYNLIFVIPLLIVFFLVYRGLSSEALSKWFQKRLAMVKFLTALFFLLAGLGIILL